MAGIVRALDDLLEVVGKTDQIENAQTVVVVQACGVDVTVDDAHRVKIRDGARKLSKNAEDFLC